MGTSLSDFYDQEMGVPQGSILSVILFIAKINSITSCIRNGVDISLYLWMTLVSHMDPNTCTLQKGSSNLITICGKHYVGQTKRPFVERLREHIRNIKQDNPIHIVGRHFNEPDHKGTKALEVQVLNFAKGHPDSKSSLKMRLELEKMWIERLRCFVPSGLNLMKTPERNTDKF